MIARRYTVRQSGRLKRARIEFREDEGLVVAVPIGFDLALVPHLVESNIELIRRAAREQNRLRLRERRLGECLPHRIALTAIDEEWHVEYLAGGGSGVVLCEHRFGLAVHGETRSSMCCAKALEKWLKKKSHKHLVPRLNQIAEHSGFGLNKVFVRSQKSRWASCSALGNISLNVRLLFVKPELVDHVLLHELCHTVHLDHSQQFWALVRRHDSAYKQKACELKQAWKRLPEWLKV